MRLTALLATLLLLPVLAETDGAKPDKPAPEKTAGPSKPPVTREGSVEIDGKTIDYTVTSALLDLKKPDGSPRASVFHVSYLRKDVVDPSTRPVMFAFNGGPGSSAVWLHLGMLGPYRLALPGTGVEAPAPPTRLVGNEFSILDVADLVFVDPVSTGYSRVGEKAKPAEFHGLKGDVESLGDFIRRWITEHGRWGSPKYLLGESYGGVRVAGLADHLQSRYGMSLNGVVLLSSLLDFRTLRHTGSDPLGFAVFLPAFTAVAHHHGVLQGDRDALVAEATDFAFGDYTIALLKGNALAEAEKQRLARRMSALTGIPAARLAELELRLDPGRFRAELLKDQGKVLGRFDARVAWPSADPERDYATYDPSYSLAYGAFATAMLTYLGDQLGWHEDSPYEILTGKVHPWDWDAENRIVDVTDRLESAMIDNPHLRVLVMKAHCDLATPPAGIDYSLRQMTKAPDSLLSRISHTIYEAGHMFYTNPPDHRKSRHDLVEFIAGGAER